MHLYISISCCTHDVVTHVGASLLCDPVIDRVDELDGQYGPKRNAMSAKSRNAIPFRRPCLFAADKVTTLREPINLTVCRCN